MPAVAAGEEGQHCQLRALAIKRVRREVAQTSLGLEGWLRGQSTSGSTQLPVTSEDPALERWIIRNFKFTGPRLLWSRFSLGSLSPSGKYLAAL